MNEWERTEHSWSTQVPINKIWNVFSRSFLAFMFPVVRRSMKTSKLGPLEREELPGLPTKLKFDSVYDRITLTWSQEKTKPNPSLRRAIVKASRHILYPGAILSILQGLLSAVGRPLVLRYLVLGVKSNMSVAESIGYIVLFCVVSFLEGYIGVVGRQILAEEFGTQYQQCISNLLMSKVGYIDTNAFHQQDKSTKVASMPKDMEGAKENTGEENNEEEDNEEDETYMDAVLMKPEIAQITPEEKSKRKFRIWGKKKSQQKGTKKNLPPAAETSIIGNDLVRAYQNLRAAASLPMALASVVGGVIVLLITVGSSSLVGLAIMLLILLLNMLVSRKSFDLEKQNLKNADERLQIVSSILDSVRAVKLFGWEGRFLERIEAIRNKETIGIAKYRIAHVTNVVMGRASPVLSSMVTLVVFALSSSTNELNMATAFVTLSVFQSLRLGLIMIPLAAHALMAVSVSLERMQKYLLTEDLPTVDHTSQKETTSLLEMQDVFVSFPATIETPVLVDINCVIRSGQAVALTGSVGSGKTTFLRTALQLLKIQKGTRYITDHVGYVPQRPLIIGGTLRDNVLMGRPFDPVLFQECVEKSQLQADLDRFPQREMLEIGEKGTTLSGGQQQRLSMARALYSKPKLLCLDDPFSAVDAKVCRKMFESCIQAEVANNTGILIVINQLSYLPLFDQVLFLHKKKIRLQGKFTDIKNDKIFEGFVQSFVEENQEVKEEEVVVIKSENNQNEEKTKPVSTATSILLSEKRSHGKISLGVYIDYLRAFGYFFVFLCALLIFGGYTCMVFNDLWLSLWAFAESTRTPTTPSNTYYATIYAVLSCAFALLILSGSFAIAIGGVRASRKLHGEVIRKVLWAPMYWYEGGTTGRIMSRFSGDLSAVDMYVSLNVDNASQLIAQLLATVIVVCIVVSYYLVPVAFVAFILFIILLITIDRTLRETKRLSNSNLSPVISNIAEATVGLREIGRAFGKEYILLEQFFKRRHEMSTDEYSRANFISGTCINFSFLYAHVIAFFIAMAAACLMVLLKDSYDQAFLGIALTYALVIPYLSSMSAQSLTTMNMSFTSLERLLEYKNLPQEAPHSLPTDPSDTEWPNDAVIVFDHVDARYRPGLPLCLSQCTFTIRGGESIGIVGRTGSGKSSLVAVLFRLIEPAGGSVSIDGVNIQAVGLDALRSRITIVPQDPVLMSGTVRYNLDPFSEQTDELLLQCLNRVGLKRVLLTDVIDKQGSNISAGERQLLCFARALVLKKNRIVVMDEPSSSLDMQTDGLIVQLVQNELRIQRKMTILTIAHRVETIIQADRILVMRDGQVLEYDEPRRLLRKQDSEFASLVNSLGPNASTRLLTIADSNVSSNISNV